MKFRLPVAVAVALLLGSIGPGTASALPITASADTIAEGFPLALTMTVDDSATRLVLRGPSSSWFAWGFGATTMAGYTVIVQGLDAKLTDALQLTPRFDAQGLITAVATDVASGDVLMVAHMNAEALKLSIETGEAHYWSRSRGALWHKGATSGQIQKIIELRIDCDQDAVWLKVAQQGAGCCHVGYPLCFYRIVRHDDGSTRLVMVENK